MPKKYREKDIETRLRDRVKSIGGVAYKFTSPQRRSVPDRLCILPNGIIFFVECKAPGKKPTPLQAREIGTIRHLGIDVYIIDSYEDIDGIISIYNTETN